MPLVVSDKLLLDAENKAQVTRLDILEQLKNLNATALEVKAELEKIYRGMFPIDEIVITPGPETTH